MATDPEQMTAEQAEKYVRERWEDANIHDRSTEIVIDIPDGDGHHKWWFGKSFRRSWLAAAEYTRQHERKITEKQEEIEWMAESFGHARGCECSDCIVRDRIRALLESKLAELMRGWRQQ